MPRTFNDSLDHDVEAVFLNTDEFAVTVSLYRGTQSTSGIVALVARKTTGTEPPDQEMIGTDIESRNYRIRASEYLVNAVAVIPRVGDVIVETLRSGVTIRCEVQPTYNEPCYESDLQGLMYLIHTKRVE